MSSVEKAAQVAWAGAAAFCFVMTPTVIARADTTSDSSEARTATQAFDIAPQPLASALIRFSETTGVQLFFDASMARDLQSPGVKGTLTAEDALGRLLSGTGLSYRFTNATTVTLQKAAAGSGQSGDFHGGRRPGLSSAPRRSAPLAKDSPCGASRVAPPVLWHA